MFTVSVFLDLVGIALIGILGWRIYRHFTVVKPVTGSRRGISLGTNDSSDNSDDII